MVRIHQFIGAESRDGFVEADRGILDSIKDLTREARRRRREFRIVDTEAEATLRLYVIKRGEGKASGSLTAPIFGSWLTVPIDSVGVETLLRVGDYERSFVGAGDMWTDCAIEILKDLVAWATANRARLRTP